MIPHKGWYYTADQFNNFDTIWFVVDELITPDLNGLILPGITRDSLLAIAREWVSVQVKSMEENPDDDSTLDSDIL